MKKILILTANPKDTEKLRLDEEVREIQEGLQRSRRRDQFEIIARWAVRTEDLRRALLDHEPQIVHFSGHGAGERGLVLENNAGRMQPVTGQALARLFKLFNDRIECVLLNACYSATQARSIHQHIDCVIGMGQAIGDRAAIEFAMGFYDGLGAGRTYPEAFEFGLSGIDLEGLPDIATPQLLLRSVADPPPPPDPPRPPDPGLEFPEGQVPLDSPFYVERYNDQTPIEAHCCREILKPSALIRIKAPRQMGKSSLMARILHQARQQGYHTVNLSFQEADDEIFSTLQGLLQWLCASLAYGLGLPAHLDRYWTDEPLAKKQKCSNYLQDYLFKQLQAPLVLGLDEVDRVFQYREIASEFLGMLRAWHDAKKNDPAWQRLRLIITHSQEVYVPLNVNQSPFNVGIPIDLPEFTPAQVADLAQRHGLHLGEGVRELTAMFGGHPYLLRLALYALAAEGVSLGDLLATAPTQGGRYGEHLRHHLENLNQHPSLGDAMYQVVSAPGPIQINDQASFKLKSMGLIRPLGDRVEPLGNLYRLYFRDRLSP